MKFFLIFFSFLFLYSNCCFAFFKKQEPKKTKMVETKQEWETEAADVPLSERPPYNNITIEQNKKIETPKPHYVFEKYNYPAGSRKINIEDVKKRLYSYPYVVADINCRYIAYPRYYFSGEYNQIFSSFYVEKLDTSKNKTKRILEYNHNSEIRTPIIEAGLKENYPNLFRGLTLVDWSHDSKKLLIKEQTGSLLGGIYKTYLYVHFLSENDKNSYTIKLENFDNAIKNYFLDFENLQLIKYKYSLEPLGFSADNDNIIIVLCWAYNKDNKKVFLGKWGYNCSTNEILLLSKTDSSHEISLNGLILRQTYD